MVERGLMDSVKEGGFSGAAVGLTVASVRMFLFGRETAIKEMAKQASAEKAAAIVAAQKGGAITSTAAKAPILRPNIYPTLMKTSVAYAGVGAIFLGTETLLQNNRGKDDHWNRIIAGACAGSVVGVRTGSFFVSAGASATMAGAMALAHLFNYSVGSTDKDYFKKRKELIYRQS